jgi:hypothetical protein
MVHALLGGDPPVVDQRLDHRLVVGDLEELTAAQQVRPRVADLDEGELRSRPEHRGQRRAHAPQGGLGFDQVTQRGISLLDGLLQRAGQVGHGDIRIECLQHVDDGRAGAFPAGVPADSVGDREQAGTGIRRVLVPVTMQADIRPHGGADSHGHVPSMATVWRIRPAWSTNRDSSAHRVTPLAV